MQMPDTCTIPGTLIDKAYNGSWEIRTGHIPRDTAIKAGLCAIELYKQVDDLECLLPYDRKGDNFDPETSYFIRTHDPENPADESSIFGNQPTNVSLDEIRSVISATRGLDEFAMIRFMYPGFEYKAHTDHLPDGKRIVLRNLLGNAQIKISDYTRQQWVEFTAMPGTDYALSAVPGTEDSYLHEVKIVGNTPRVTLTYTD